MNESFSNPQSQLDFSLLDEEEVAVNQTIAANLGMHFLACKSASPQSPPIPFLIRRAALLTLCPSLSGMLDEARNDCQIAGANTDLVGLLVPYEVMAALLPPQKHSVSSAFVLFLPDKFEPLLLDSLSQRPGIGHYRQFPHHASDFYLEWKLDERHRVLVPHSTLHSHLFHNFEYGKDRFDFSKNVFTPFIFVSGNSAVVGGFKVNDDVMDYGQCEYACVPGCESLSHFEYLHLTHAERNPERLRATPWDDKWFQLETGCLIREPWVRDFTKHLFEESTPPRADRGAECQDI
jgi:hypothetical protein